MFGCILKILFSYYFLTFSHPFSQLPNKFYNRKFQYINLKKQKSKQHYSLNFTIRSNWEREEERVIKNWGKGRDRSWFMGDEIGHESWATRSVMGNDKIETRSRGRRDWSSVMMRGWRDWSWVTTAPMRSVLGGSVIHGDAISVGWD